VIIHGHQGEHVIDSHVIAFTIAAAALTIAPGPDTMLVIRNVLRGGRREGVVTTFGICSGLFVHATLSALGISIVLARSAAAFNIVKIIGALYLSWLGLQSLRAAVCTGNVAPLANGLERERERDSARCFREGMLSNVLNPKTAFFYLAFLPQFISPSDSVLAKSLLLAGIHYGEAVSWLVAVSVLVDRMRRIVFGKSVRRWLDGLCGTLFIAFGARLAFSRE
jgi:RhtB (resistance to homoserine/threonine) family protein